MVSYGLIFLRITQEWAMSPLSVTGGLSCGSLLPGLFTQRGTRRLLHFRRPVRLAGGMSLLAGNLWGLRHLHPDDESGRLLVQMSPATIRRLPSGEKGTCRLRELCHTRSTPLHGRIPVQAWMDSPLDWADTEQDGACRASGLGHDQRYALAWTAALPVMEPLTQSVSWLRGSW